MTDQSETPITADWPAEAGELVSVRMQEGDIPTMMTVVRGTPATYGRDVTWETSILPDDDDLLTCADVLMPICNVPGGEEAMEEGLILMEVYDTPLVDAIEEWIEREWRARNLGSVTQSL